MERLDIYVYVDDGVYPVCEDTLLMIRSVEIAPDEKFLEMGCGTGITGLHAAKNGAKVTLVDYDPVAVNCAYHNAEENKLEVTALQSDLFENVEGAYDVMVFNPPYLPGSTGEGDLRLDGGEGGIEVAKKFLDKAGDYLAKNGRVYLLLSSLSHREKLQEAVPQWKWDAVGSEKLFFEELTVWKLSL